MPDVPFSAERSPKISIVMKDSGLKVEGWTGFSLESAIDATSNRFAFRVPFEPTPLNIEVFRPYAPGVVQIFLDEEMLLLGYFERWGTGVSGGSREISIEGRSASGAIEEWSAGPTWNRAAQSFNKDMAFDLEGLTAQGIVSRIAAAHLVRFQPDTGRVDELAITPGQSVAEIIGRLAAANGYFGVPSAKGELIYRNDMGDTAPVAKIEEGSPAVISISCNHDVTKRAWKYRAMGSATGQPNVWADELDPELAPAIRGIKIIQPEQQPSDIQAAAKRARTQAFISSYSVSIELVGFAYNSGGGWKFWKAGDVVIVKAPSAFILKESRFIIKRVVFSCDESGGYKTTLELTFPELYSGKSPKERPWFA